MGGGIGSLLVIIIFSNLPILPLSKFWFKELCPGSYLLLNPIWIFGLYLEILFLHLLILFKSRSKGFSQNTTFLFTTASSINFKCVFVLDAINIHLIFLSLNAIFGFWISIEFYFLDSFFVNFWSLSKIYFRLKSLWFIRLLACIWPILPSPNSAILIIFLPIFFFLRKFYTH